MNIVNQHKQEHHMNIGFIGLGIMGSRMAGHLLSNGHQLIVHNRTKSKADDLIKQGAIWADTPADIAPQADIIITMLAHPQAVEATALGDDGFLQSFDEGKLWIDCSTVNPSFSKQMADEATAHGIHFLDAPVAGSKNQAQDGVLAFIVGGDVSDVEVATPLFDIMGSRVVHVGGHGMGTSLKIVVNYLLASAMASFAEGMVLGESLGISQEMLFKVLIGGPVVPPFMAGKQPTIESSDYDPEFPLQWMKKDVQLATQTAYENGVAMPVANATKELYQLANRGGMGELDFSAIYQFLSGK